MNWKKIIEYWNEVEQDQNSNEYHILTMLLDKHPKTVLYESDDVSVVWSDLGFGANYCRGSVVRFYYLKEELQEKLKELKNV